MSGMMPPQNMPMMPGPMPAGPMPTGPYPMPGPQPFAFGPATVNQPAAPAPPTPVTPQQPPPESPASETVKPAFDLGFDPSAKAALPFDLPGFSGPAEQTPAAPLPAPSFPAPSFPAPAFPAGFAAPTMPVTPLQPGAGNQDFLQSVPTVRDEPSWAGGTPPAPADFLASMPAGPEKATEKPPTVLHIRCPSGHLVVATSDLLGKNGRCPACKKTFELRYEDSVEFKRRKEKILQREEIKTGNAWLAWAFLAAFLVFAGLVGLVLVFGR
jgi:hypothetical protein